MKCKNAKLCDRIFISSSVSVVGTDLVINIPQNVFINGFTGCLVIAQNIPDEATINIPVVITIGDDTTTTYPLINKCCIPVTASGLRTRTRYPFRVFTTQTSATFKLLCGVPCAHNNLQGIPIAGATAPATGG
jgi:hypothetical protein